MLVVTVRVDEPAVAVIVTEDALVEPQLNVTLCPLLIEVALAVRVTVGAEVDDPLELVPQEQHSQRADKIRPQEKV